MKKVLLLGSALVLGLFFKTNAQDAKAQYISLGPVFGIGASRISNMPGSENIKASPYLGIGLVYARNAHWGWGGELGISHEGYSTDIGLNTLTVNPVYLRMPLRAYYFFGSYKSAVRPKVYLGPTIGVKLDEVQYMNGNRMVNSDVYTTYYTTNSDQFRTVDIGLNAGGGLNVRLAQGVWLNMDMGYNLGFTDAVADAANNYNVNENMRFNIGVLFGLK